jgi:hypothetical protein
MSTATSKRCTAEKTDHAHVMEAGTILTELFDQLLLTIVDKNKEPGMQIKDALQKFKTPLFHPAFNVMGMPTVQHMDEPTTADAQGLAVGSGPGFVPSGLYQLPSHAHGRSSPQCSV